MVDVSSSDHAYFDLLSALWAAGADFLIIEHDMVPTQGLVDEMMTCPQPWCVNGYVSNEYGTLSRAAFGFTRFRAPIMAGEPDAFEVAAVKYRGLIVRGRSWPGTHWQGLDGRFDCVMGDRGRWRPHMHEAAITHLRHWSE
jgi:hypothetical protein